MEQGGVESIQQQHTLQRRYPVRLAPAPDDAAVGVKLQELNSSAAVAGAMPLPICDDNAAVWQKLEHCVEERVDLNRNIFPSAEPAHDLSSRVELDQECSVSSRGNGIPAG